MSEETKPSCRDCKHRGLWVVLTAFQEISTDPKPVLETVRVECRRYAPNGERSICTFPLQVPEDRCGEWAPRDE